MLFLLSSNAPAFHFGYAKPISPIPHRFIPVPLPLPPCSFYFAFDHNDPIFENADMRSKIEAEAQRMFKEENERRWHPEGHVPGSTVDGSTLLMSIHWVHCNYAGKPAWAHSDAVMAAYVEGADYAIRMNDDTAFPTVKDWADRMIGDLRGREIANLGVVGPACSAGANWILTHDFTHRTHAAVFGYQYPRSLPGASLRRCVLLLMIAIGGSACCFGCRFSSR